MWISSHPASPAARWRANSPLSPGRHGGTDDDVDARITSRVVELEQFSDVVDGAGRRHDVDAASHQSGGSLGVWTGSCQHDDRRGNVGTDEAVAAGRRSAQPFGDHASSDEADRRRHGRTSEAATATSGCGRSIQSAFAAAGAVSVMRP